MNCLGMTKWFIHMIWLELTVQILTTSGQLYNRHRNRVLEQPLFDLVDIERYFKNDRLVNFQTKCLFHHNKPCDFVGKWLKSKLSDALLGQCYECTAVQAANLEKIILHLKRHRPDVYNKAVHLYLDQDRLAAAASNNYWHKSRRPSIDTSLWDILTTTKSSVSFSVPILPSSSSTRKKKKRPVWTKSYRL